MRRLRHQHDQRRISMITMPLAKPVLVFRTTSRPSATNIASDAHFANLAANRLDHLQFVVIYNLDLSLVTHERRDANVGQRRSELHVVRSKLDSGTPILKRVTGIKQ